MATHEIKTTPAQSGLEVDMVSALDYFMEQRHMVCIDDDSYDNVQVMLYENEETGERLQIKMELTWSK